MMRRAYFFIVLFMFLNLGTGWGEEIRETVEKKVPAEGISVVNVKATNGSITLSAWDKNEISIVARKKVNTSPTKGQRVLKDMHLIVQREGHQLSIYTKTVGRSSGNLFDWLFGLGIKNFQVDYEIKVPAQMTVKAYSTNGDVEVDDVTGRLDLSTTNGSINALRISNTGKMHSTNGDVHVYYHQLPTKGRIDISTTNGEVELVLPKDSACSISAYTTNGHVNCRIPNVQGQISRNHIDAYLNVETPKIEATSTNGDITISSK